jgi:hypothetical protein
VTDRRSAVTVIGKEGGGGLQETGFCVRNHTVVCIKSRDSRQHGMERTAYRDRTLG